MDPRFTSPLLSPKRNHNEGRHLEQAKFRNIVEDTGALSDESLHYKGCFPKNKSKKRSHSFRIKPNEEKQQLIQRQLELQYQLNESKLILEKQMRKMRRKFEKALRVTDERFLEQKQREHNYHSQLRQELEIIETSLQRGSKKNVEEFTLHIKNELNSLAEKLTKGGSTESIDKKRNRASFVDLERDISVNLPLNNVDSTVKLRKKCNNARRSNGQCTVDPSIPGTITERENELLRARIHELERIVQKTSINEE